MATLPHDEQDTEQEILAPQAQNLDSTTLALLNKSEIDQQITTAKKFPRAITKLLTTATALATADTDTADECIYALPRGGKIIEGPSVRFAEIMAYSWGNCRCGARVISEDEEFVTAMGSFFDMEMNVHIGYEVKRRITNKEGKRFNSDMIGTTSNAACSIALRNAILRGIPKAIWKKVYAQARQAVAGDIKTLDARRQAMLKAFDLMGAKREQVFSLLDVKGLDDITLDHLVSLRGIYNAIREGETTVARAFAPKDTQDLNLADKSRANLEKLKEKYSQPQEEVKRELRVGPPPESQAEKVEASGTQENGASQPPIPPEHSGESAPAPVAAAEPQPVEARTAAPSEKQESEVLPTSPTPAGPEGGAPSGPSVFEESFFPEDEGEPGQHGVPLGFNEPVKGKSNRKR